MEALANCINNGHFEVSLNTDTDRIKLVWIFNPAKCGQRVTVIILSACYQIF